jgi:hypothetical protein
MGVRRIDDPQHPRGYREIRSNAEMRKLMDRKIVAQNGACRLCNGRFTNYDDIVPDHISPLVWEGRGEMTIPTTSRRFIGGATEKRDQIACNRTLSMFRRQRAGPSSRRTTTSGIPKFGSRLRGDA